VLEALQKAQQEERLRAEIIQEIVQEALTASISEAQEGSVPLTVLVKEASGVALEFLQEKGEANPENVSAVLQGTIRGASNFQRQSIVQSKTKIEQLQQKVAIKEQNLEGEIAIWLKNIKENQKAWPENIKRWIDRAVEDLQKREETALLQKHYAQLKVQLAILQANLAEQYGDKYQEINKYLEEAKAWYERAKENPELFSDKIKEKHDAFEEKLGRSGSALAQKEKQAQELLKDLWRSVSELFQDTKD
jgi:hypothetical protein